MKGKFVGELYLLPWLMAGYRLTVYCTFGTGLSMEISDVLAGIIVLLRSIELLAISPRKRTTRWNRL